MELKVFKSLWGMTGTLDENLDRIAEAGYNGVETAVPEEGLVEFGRKLQVRGLEYIGMLFVLDSGSFLEGMKKARDLGAIKVNSHSGRDCWDFEEGCRYLEGALEAEASVGIPAGHETHRYRLFYNPWVTAAYLRRFPELKITADFSHWTVVCESLLDDMGEHLELAIQRAAHVHARVGHHEGPQVSDPRAPEFQDFVAQFEQWWDGILDAHIARGEKLITVDPEFGPPRYMPTLPYTQQPVADLWEICSYMADRVKKRWEGKVQVG